MERLLIAGESEILIGPRLLEDAALLPERRDRTKAAVLTEPAAGRWSSLVARRLRDEGMTVESKELAGGEPTKSLAVVGEIYSWLSSVGLSRFDTVVAIGGGAVTDVAGFAAATYLRGIEAVYIPTTLLGAVDAAIGGKTGVNLEGKNIIGAFRHPARVVIDTELLDALPPPLKMDGAAEALKAGLIGDPDLVALYERDGADAPIDEVIRRAVSVKARIVEEDFADRSRRAVLNYGHTIGHAVEVACGLTHGQAVGVGMVAAGVVAERLVAFGEAERQRELIASLGLPVEVSGATRPEVNRLLGMDKKRDAGGLRMVLLERIGAPVLAHVDAATVGAGLAAVEGR